MSVIGKYDHCVECRASIPTLNCATPGIYLGKNCRDVHALHAMLRAYERRIQVFRPRNLDYIDEQ